MTIAVRKAGPDTGFSSVSPSFRLTISSEKTPHSTSTSPIRSSCRAHTDVCQHHGHRGSKWKRTISAIGVLLVATHGDVEGNRGSATWRLAAVRLSGDLDRVRPRLVVAVRHRPLHRGR